MGSFTSPTRLRPAETQLDDALLHQAEAVILKLLMKTSKRRIGTLLIPCAGVALCFLALGAVNWLLEESVSARMRMSFESQPPEGYNFWYWKEFRRQLPEAICYALPIFAALALLVRQLVKLAKAELPKR